MAVAPLALCARKEPGLFGPLEVVELSNGATQLDLGVRTSRKCDRNETSLALAMFRFDDKVGERPGDGVDYHAS